MSGPALTDEQYWTGRWQRGRPQLGAVDPADRRLGNASALAWHLWFREVLGGLPPGSRLIEVGAARSRWLPYFARQFGFDVTGLDYSGPGCKQAEEILAAAGVKGEIVHGDLFDPPLGLVGRFDVVASFGVVEHFPDTAACLRACARLLAPGGLMVTTIPNMRGTVGLAQRLVDEEVYRTHVPLDDRELAEAHRSTGLEVVSCGYQQFANWRLVSTGEGRLARRKRLLRRALGGLTTLALRAQRLGLALPANRLTSPYLACLAREKGRQ